MRSMPLLLALGFALASSAMAQDRVKASGTAAHAALMDANGASHGNATFADTGAGIDVWIAAEGLPPGTHGVHLHGVGRCDAPDFQSAGPHWNPGMKQHGRDNPQGAHSGDLPNIEIGANGRGTLRFTVPMAKLSDLLDADGAAIVVHAKPDDYRTDPSGNSGARIGCGVISR